MAARAAVISPPFPFFFRDLGTKSVSAERGFPELQRRHTWMSSKSGVGDRTQIGPATQIYAADHPGMPKRGGAASNSGVRYGSAATSG